MDHPVPAATFIRTQCSFHNFEPIGRDLFL